MIALRAHRGKWEGSNGGRCRGGHDLCDCAHDPNRGCGPTDRCRYNDSAPGTSTRRSKYKLHAACGCYCALRELAMGESILMPTETCAGSNVQAANEVRATLFGRLAAGGGSCGISIIRVS